MDFLTVNGAVSSQATFLPHPDVMLCFAVVGF